MRVAEFGVAGTGKVEVGGTLGRGGEVRCFQEQGFRTFGVDGHGVTLVLTNNSLPLMS